MKPASGFSPKACWKARRYRRWMCSDIKKGKTFETDYGSARQRTPNLKRRWDHINRKPRSMRKRSSECWADRVYKEHRVSERIGTTEESCLVQRTETTSCGPQGVENGERKLKLRIRLANRLVELEEGEIPPTPSPERLVANVDDCDCQAGVSVQSPGTSQLVSKDTEEHSKTCNETVQAMKETETPVTKSKGLCLSDSNLQVDKTQPADMIDCVRDASPDKKEPSTSTGGTEIVESDTDSDIVELIGQKDDTATSNVKSCEVASKSTYVEESRHPNDTEEHSKTCNETVQAMKETETPVTKSKGLCLSDSNLQVDKTQPADMIDCVRDASPDKKEPSTSTGGTAIVVESDTDSDIVELIGQKDDTATSNVKSCEVASKSTYVEESRHPNAEIYDSVDEPAACSTQSVTIGVANLPASQERQAVTQICSESHVQFTGTHTSVTPLDTSTVERASIPCNQVYGLHSFHVPGSRTNLQDFRSLASGVTSMNDSFQASLVNPYRAQLSCYDPLQNEMERLKKHHEQELKMHEARMLQMKLKRDEDIQEVLKKYDILFQDAEAVLQHKTIDFHAKFQKVYLSKLVATAAILNHNYCQEEALTPETGRAASDNVNHLDPNPTQIRSPVVPLSTVAINQVSQLPARPCSGGLMDCSTILYQNVYEFRAAAPHLRASSSQSFSPSLLFPVPNNGEFIQHLPRYSHNN